jgi:hypothetical protein
MGNWQADCWNLQWKCNKGNMRAWCQLLQEGTTHNPMLPPIHVHYSNRTSGKFKSILHIILILHQMIITHFPTSQNFWLARVWRVNKRWKTLHKDRLKDLATTFSGKGIQNPVPLYENCLNLQCDYIYQQITKKDTLIKIL